MEENENKEKIAKFLAIYALIAPEVMVMIIRILNSNSIIGNIFGVLSKIVSGTTFITIIIAKIIAPENKTVRTCFII